MKQALELMYGGEFMNKGPEEAVDFLRFFIGNSRGWGYIHTHEQCSKAT